MRQLSDELREPLFAGAEKRDKAARVAQYLQRHMFRHQKYFYYFTLFEVANFVNVILQVYVVDAFLGGTFTTYGLDVLNYTQLEQDERVDPMVRVFPKMTKCTFHRFGSSGDVQRHDALCILPLNIINEKIYIIMWFWFVFLAIVSGLWLVYRFFTWTRPEFRLKLLSKRASLANKRVLKHLLGVAEAGDWFLLYMLCKNTDSQSFRFITRVLSRRLELEAKEKARESLRNGHKRRANRVKATAEEEDEMLANQTEDSDSELDTEIDLENETRERREQDEDFSEAPKSPAGDSFEGIRIDSNKPMAQRD